MITHPPLPSTMQRSSFDIVMIARVSIFTHNLIHNLIQGPLKVTVVIGTPIPVQQESAPSEALVKQLMDSYFRALLRMFERHKIAAGESADRRLVLIESDGKPYKIDDIW